MSANSTPFPSTGRLRKLSRVICTLALGIELAAYGFAMPIEVVPLTLDNSPVFDLKFRDFFRLPVGPLGLEFSHLLRALDGQRVSVLGYMVAQEDAPVGRFFLTPIPVRMSEHADGDADDLPPGTVVVIMPAIDQKRPIPHHDQDQRRRND